MCDSCSWGTYQLWYPHYDDWDSFDDFEQTGCWTTPSIKQFNGDVDVGCGMTIDQDYY